MPLSIQTICLTVRLDMDHGPMLYRTTSVVAGENAAPNLFANLLLKQGGEPAEAHRERQVIIYHSTLIAWAVR